MWSQNGKNQSCSKLPEMARKLIENVFWKFWPKFLPLEFSLAVGSRGSHNRKRFALVAEGNHCSRLQRGVAPWSRIAPLRAGGTWATASPSALLPPSVKTYKSVTKLSLQFKKTFFSCHFRQFRATLFISKNEGGGSPGGSTVAFEPPNNIFCWFLKKLLFSIFYDF